ncbi:MAG: hypothetical protein EOP94_02790 [Zymomonas sp.]|nr:MAG: hypothetical protein EOP94_02790 [Zymomonas sp.]
MAETLRAHAFADHDRQLRDAGEDSTPVLAALNSNAIAVTTEAIEETDGNWPSAMKLVERAAATIKDYERKFKDVEADTRAFMQRVEEEQARLHAYIASLEANVAELETRAQETDAALHDVKIEAWETKLKLRSTETRLAEAEAETQRANGYALRVGELLGEI